MKVYNYVSKESEFNPIKAVGHCNTARYKFASSENIIEYLDGRGFTMIDSSAAQCRKPEKAGKQKHIMIFEHNDFNIDAENSLQLLVTNSHDGTSSVIINLGIYRTVCANGLVVGDSFFEQRIKHVGHMFYNNLRLSLDAALETAPEIVSQVKGMQNMRLSLDVIDQLCREIAPVIDKPVFYSDLERSRRTADNVNTLYNVLNRIQENVIKGGIRYVSEDKKGNNVIRKTREIKAIDRKRKVNQFVWDKAVNLLTSEVA